MPNTTNNKVYDSYISNYQTTRSKIRRGEDKLRKMRIKEFTSLMEEKKPMTITPVYCSSETGQLEVDDDLNFLYAISMEDIKAIYPAYKKDLGQYLVGVELDVFVKEIDEENGIIYFSLDGATDGETIDRIKDALKSKRSRYRNNQAQLSRYFKSLIDPWVKYTNKYREYKKAGKDTALLESEKPSIKPPVVGGKIVEVGEKYLRIDILDSGLMGLIYRSKLREEYTGSVSNLYSVGDSFPVALMAYSYRVKKDGTIEFLLSSRGYLKNKSPWKKVAREANLHDYILCTASSFPKEREKSYFWCKTKKFEGIEIQSDYNSKMPRGDVAIGDMFLGEIKRLDAKKKRMTVCPYKRISRNSVNKTSEPDDYEIDELDEIFE